MFPHLLTVKNLEFFRSAAPAHLSCGSTPTQPVTLGRRQFLLLTLSPLQVQTCLQLCSATSFAPCINSQRYPAHIGHSFQTTRTYFANTFVSNESRCDFSVVRISFLGLQVLRQGAFDEFVLRTAQNGAADSRQPTADSRQPTADSRQPTTDSGWRCRVKYHRLNDC